MGHSQSKHYSEGDAAHRSPRSTINDDERNIHTFPNTIVVKPNISKSRMMSLNIHEVQPDIKIHACASQAYIDPGDENALHIPLGEVTDEQLLAEVARRKLDIHHNVSESLVRETYVFEKNIGHGASGESPKCLWLILEYVNGGDLRDHILNSINYTEIEAARYIKQILLAVHYLHSLGIVHRDLKLDNILRQIVNDTSVMKVADFGLSALVRIGDNGYDAEESGKRKGYRELKEMWGTKEFFAPELIDQAYGPQADVWSLGCIMYEMLSGRLAFPYRIMKGFHSHTSSAPTVPRSHLIYDRERSQELYNRIQAGKYDINIPAFRHISNDAKDLLRQFLTVDPLKRVSATEALQHPWITGASHTQEHNVHLEETVANFRLAHQNRRR